MNNQGINGYDPESGLIDGSAYKKRKNSRSHFFHILSILIGLLTAVAGLYVATANLPDNSIGYLGLIIAISGICTASYSGWSETKTIIDKCKTVKKSNEIRKALTAANQHRINHALNVTEEFSIATELMGRILEQKKVFSPNKIIYNEGISRQKDYNVIRDQADNFIKKYSDKEDIEIFLFRALANYFTGQFLPALSDIKFYLSRKSHPHPYAIHLQGNIYRAMADKEPRGTFKKIYYEYARAEFEKAHRCNPYDFIILKDMGRVLSCIGDNTIILEKEYYYQQALAKLMQAQDQLEQLYPSTAIRIYSDQSTEDESTIRTRAFGKNCKAMVHVNLAIININLARLEIIPEKQRLYDTAIRNCQLVLPETKIYFLRAKHVESTAYFYQGIDWLKEESVQQTASTVVSSPRQHSQFFQPERQTTGTIQQTSSMTVISVERVPRQRLSSEKNIKSLLDKRLPSHFQLGAAMGKGDCFFDAMAQGINQWKGNKECNVKSLRLLCDTYAKNPYQPTWVKSELTKEGNYEEYLVRIQFTVQEMEENAYQGILKREEIVWGRPWIEGRMICDQFKIKLHVIEVLETPVQGNHVTEQQVDAHGSRSLEAFPPSEYLNSKIVHVVVYKSHFVPLINEKLVNQSHISQLTPVIKPGKQEKVYEEIDGSEASKHDFMTLLDEHSLKKYDKKSQNRHALAEATANFQRALTLYERILEVIQLPNNYDLDSKDLAPYYYTAGLIETFLAICKEQHEEKTQRFQRANAYFQTSLNLNAAYSKSHYGIFKVYIAQDQFRQAKEYIERILKTTYIEDSSKGHIYANYASIMLRLNEDQTKIRIVVNNAKTYANDDPESCEIIAEVENKLNSNSTNRNNHDQSNHGQEHVPPDHPYSLAFR